MPDLDFDTPVMLDNYNKQQEDKELCATYNWIWNDEEPVEKQSNNQNDNQSIDEMKSARAQQEEKLKQFMAKLKPLALGPRKTSMDVQPELLSPKKKKIRKMTSYK